MVMKIWTKADEHNGLNETARPVDEITSLVGFTTEWHNNIKAFSICYNGSELIRTEISSNNITL